MSLSIDDQPGSRAPVRLHDQCRRLIRDAGFDLLAITPAVDSRGVHDLVRWIDRGYAGQMDYFTRRLDAYRHPDGVLAKCRALIALTLPYHDQPPTDRSSAADRSSATDAPPAAGRVARYAWSGVDYHDVVHQRLRPIKNLIATHHSGANARVVVDTAPLLEREVAAAAGLGWRGKNTLLLNKSRGSYFFLACVLVDIDLQSERPATPFSGDADNGHCGNCTACLDACPTDAFPSAGVLDATRCISYLTIEHRGPIDASLRPLMGDWLFGCDVCQEVCPWNKRHASRTPPESISNSPMRSQPPTMRTFNAIELLRMDEEAFRRRFRKTPMWRTRRAGLLRNAAIFLGNFRPDGSAATLSTALDDGDTVVRGAAVWAWSRLRPPSGRERLTMMAASETDSAVTEEIRVALRDWTT